MLYSLRLAVGRPAPTHGLGILILAVVEALDDELPLVGGLGVGRRQPWCGGARIRIKIFIYFRFGFTSLETNKISFYQTLYNMSFIRKLGGEVRIFKNLCGCGRRILSSLTYSRREGRRGSIYFCNVNKKSIIRK